MASYCDEFSFDEVFEDPSYVQVSINKTRQVTSYSLLQDEDDKDKDDKDKDDKEKEKEEEKELFEMGLHELEFMKDSMTEEELDRFWKEMSANKYKTNRSKVYPIYDVDVDVDEKECEFYFQREILAI
jgi:hypothetical protein